MEYDLYSRVELKKAIDLEPILHYWRGGPGPVPDDLLDVVVPTTDLEALRADPTRQLLITLESFGRPSSADRRADNVVGAHWLLPTAESVEGIIGVFAGGGVCRASHLYLADGGAAGAAGVVTDADGWHRVSHWRGRALDELDEDVDLQAVLREIDGSPRIPDV